jgi:hypothetical protein
MFPPPCFSIKNVFSNPGLTTKELLTPLCAPPVLVAVIVYVPTLEIVIECEARTPAVNAKVVPPPDDIVPVEVMFTVPEKPVATFPSTSNAVMVILKGTPAVWVPIFPPPNAATTKLFTLPALTANELLVPNSTPDVFVAVIVNVPVFDIVTLCVERTPDVNAAVVPLPALNVPVDVISTVLVNEVTVLLKASFAVTLIANEVPTVCVEIFPPAVD